ncbi:MAG: hypothetical protein A2539_05840 [Elusimicrobia bacterium RIFOXYD2_FULL_34_15]|nr:MAG: hypothetical protein A2539_05840 [Elusimicrobia bacterium RIFOXYD2_FULL_34_15]
MIEIREVKSKSDLKQFVNFPYELYRGNSYWIPPLQFDELNTLSWDKNPAFEFCEARYWMAFKDNKIAGRIAGIINKKYIEIWKNKYLRFGWFDFINDEEVSKVLLEKVENWAKEKGLAGVHGPLGFTDLDREGMLIEGFNELGTMATNYNYPYYPIHIEKFGYKKDADWVEYEVKVPSQIPEKAERISQIMLKKMKLRLLDAKKSKDILKYAKGIFELLNEAYENLYGVVPLSERQIDSYTKQYFGFVSPDYLKVIIDENDKVAAFLVAMPSLSRALQKSNGKLLPFGFIHLLKALKSPKYIDLCLIAVRPSLQGKGVNALLMTEITKSSIKNSIISAETNPELESNTKVQSHWKHYDARQHKRRRCFLKTLA